MSFVKRLIVRGMYTFNTVDAPASTTLQRFFMSARLGLWPAIMVSSFAFAHLTQHNWQTATLIGGNLCLVASLAFLFNDIRDADIDAANNISRWSVRSPIDRHLFRTTVGVVFASAIASSFYLSATAAVGLAAAICVGLAYSIVCKRIFLLGNVVAAALSLSPGLIMLSNSLIINRADFDATSLLPAAAFSTVAFILLL
jgi:4-hydroxybenzoate polyprenyltransferase